MSSIDFGPSGACLRRDAVQRCGAYAVRCALEVGAVQAPWPGVLVDAAYPRSTEFRHVRNRLDPDRRFATPYLETLLGP